MRFVHTWSIPDLYSVTVRVQDRLLLKDTTNLGLKRAKHLAPETSKDLEFRGKFMWAATMAAYGLIWSRCPARLDQLT